MPMKKVVKQATITKIESSSNMSDSPFWKIGEEDICDESYVDYEFLRKKEIDRKAQLDQYDLKPIIQVSPFRLEENILSSRVQVNKPIESVRLIKNPALASFKQEKPKSSFMENVMK